MKYTYSDPHKGLMPWPLMEEPNVHDEKYYYSPGSEFAHFKKGAFYKDEAAYTSWLQETPLCLVRPEDIEWFSVERGEDEFEVIDSHKWFLSECEDCGWQGSSEKLLGGGALADTGDYGDCYCPKCESRKVEEVNTFPSYEGLVAIPKKGNESKEQSPSVEQCYSESEVVELLRQQRENCVYAYLDKFKSHGILNAPTPPLKSSLNQKQ
jgi:hypothetical protein